MADVRIETAAGAFSLSGLRSVSITCESEFFGRDGKNDFAEYTYRKKTVDQYCRPVEGSLSLVLLSHVVYGHGSYSHGWRVSLSHHTIGNPDNGAFTVGVGYANTGREARMEAFRELARKLITLAEDGTE